MSEALNLNIENISRYFKGPSGARLNVLEDISFSVESGSGSGKFISIIASFAGGKSTLLKILAGLDNPDAGEVKLNGKIYSRPTGEIVYIPEKPSSFPWMNVAENVNFAMNGNVNKNSTNEIINSVGLGGYENHFPDDGSSGFRFRIALARAIAAGAKVILLDDPFRRMKAITKDEIYELLRNLINTYGVTFILATPNITEAVYLSNKIFLMKKNPGKIIDEISLDSKTAADRGLDRQERFLSLRKQIESKFVSIGENLQTEVHF